MDVGPIKRWQIGDLHFAESEFGVRLAFVYTDDPAKVGEITIIDGIYVEYVLREQPK